jgi:hypothetical protein
MLITVVVTAVAIIAVALLSQPPPQRIPALDAVISSDGNTTIRLFHNGGDALSRQEMAVLVDGVDMTYGFTVRGMNWTRWSAGDFLEYTAESLPGKVQLVFVSGTSRTILVSADFVGRMPTFVPTIPPTPGAAATVTGISPANGITGSTVHAVISGSGFEHGAVARLVQGTSGITATNLVVVSPDRLTCIFNLEGAASGQWDVVVTNPGSPSGILSSGFTVVARGPAPSVLHITPDSGFSGSAVNISNLSGTNFISGATVRLSRAGNPDLFASGVSVPDPSTITCTVVLPYGTSPGLWDVTVQNVDGQSGVLANAFTVNDPGPVITGISPDTGLAGTSVTITRLSGSGFQNGAAVIFNSSSAPDITASDILVVNQNHITCTINLAGATLGTRNIVVTNPDGRAAVLRDGFTVRSAGVMVSGVSPSSGTVGSTVVPVSVGGNGFINGAAVRLTRSGEPDIPATGVNVGSSNLITCSISLPSGAAPGLWNVVVVNGDGQSGMLADGFRVKSPTPSVTSITPNSQVRGWTVSITSLAGSSFRPGATVMLVNSSAGPDISATNVVVVSATRITCTFDLAGAPAARRNVTVTNPYSDPGTLVNGFTVTGNAPTLTARNVSAGNRGWPVGVLLTGTGFQPGATVRLTRPGYSDIPASSLTVVSPTQITCSLNLLAAAAGTWNIQVTNPDGQTSGTLTFAINSPAPTVSSGSPATGVRGTTVSITSITGTGFQPGAVVDYYYGTTRINLTDVQVVSQTRISGTLIIPSGAPAGSYGIRVINTDGGTGTRNGRFTVTNPSPTVSAINPVQGRDGTVISPVIVTGTNFLTGARVRLYRGASLIYSAPAGTVNSPTQITTSFTIPESVIVGVTDVRVTNPDALYGTLPGGYTILE